jgi:hypothetical protein
MSHSKDYEYGPTKATHWAEATLSPEVWDTLAGKVELLDPHDHFAILAFEATEPYRYDLYCCADNFY